MRRRQWISTPLPNRTLSQSELLVPSPRRSSTAAHIGTSAISSHVNSSHRSSTKNSRTHSSLDAQRIRRNRRMYARMVIGEAISEEQVREFARIYICDVQPKLKDEPGFQSARLMVEEGGRMAVSLTIWETRDDCLNYHSSRCYRQFVSQTQHLLAGGFVVKVVQDWGRGEGLMLRAPVRARNPAGNDRPHHLFALPP